MDNKLLDVLSGKERKRYNQIIELINQKNYTVLFDMDKDRRFGLNNQKFIDRILNRIQEEVNLNPEFIIRMSESFYHRTRYFTEYAIKSNPSVIEMMIESNSFDNYTYIPLALDNGYVPSSEYINSHIRSFSKSSTMLRLIDSGYRPSNEIIENNISIFENEEVFLKVLDLGYVPSVEFLNRSSVIKNNNLIDRIFDTVELTPELINSTKITKSALVQQKIIEKKPELLLSLRSTGEIFIQFWIEAIKRGYIPEQALNEYSVSGNTLLLSKIVKYHPEYVKYSKIIDNAEREKVNELALCMGYVPTISDVRNNENVSRSSKLMHALIEKRPEAIKYVEGRPFKGGYTLNISNDEFFDLVRLALNNGYIPTEEDLNLNPRLADSFDFMKILIQDNPELINSIREFTPNKEELLRIAIENGFDGELVTRYIGTEDNGYSLGGRYDENELLVTETGIMYQIDKGYRIDFHSTYDSKSYNNDYSINLYNYLIDKGYQTSDIIDLFSLNFESMKEIISKNPEYITSVDLRLPRKQIDELGMLAINSGYEPKFEDEVFGYGSETAKLMVSKYPSYLEKVQLLDSVGFFNAKPCADYDEICRIAVDAGFLPDVTKMGNGYGAMTTIKYNYSYEIMKKAIPLAPDLIESCSVDNKDQYDELCRLAIASGYVIDNEYALTHWGKKMCSNYDLMAIYLANHPKFILNVDVTNSEEMLKLIDIAINGGLELRHLSENQLLKLFLSIDESKWGDYLEPYLIESLNKAKVLYANNDEISKTVNTRFLSDNITKNFTKAQVEILSCYPKLQEKILELPQDSYKTKIIYDLVAKYKDNLEWIPILEKALDNIYSPEFTNLLESLNDKELSSEEKDNLMYLLMTNNHLDISTYEELQNVDALRENYINMLIERNTLGSLKTAYFEKVFGIDLATAMNLVNLYGKSLESKTIESLDPNSRSEFVLLDNMKKIINLNNIDILRFYVDNINPEFVIKPDLMMTYEARLKYLFTKEFNDSFTKPNEEDKVVTDISEEADYDIYLAAGIDGKKKCRMMITSIGAYTAMEEPDDYYASWNVDKIASHGCCCSYVGEKNLGTAEVKYCCLGFTDYDMGSLQLSAPYDLCSASKEDSYEITAAYSSMFLLPDDVLAHTRHTHNESVWERRSISGDAMFKKQPSYIVYFVDNFEDRLTNPEAMRQWESVRKAASNFAIEVDGVKKMLPIMVVEREKIAKSQIEIIETKLSDFKSNHDPSLISEIISDYESNYAGNREYHPNIIEKYFPQHTELSNSVVGQIISVIEELSLSEPQIAKECLYELEKTVRSEQEKYNNTQHGVAQSVPSFNIEEAMIEINRIKSNFKLSKDSTFSIISECEENTRQFESVDVLGITPEVLDSQLSSSEVIESLNSSGLTSTITTYEEEIKSEKVNERLNVHGQRHIKNVLLYSSLIGSKVLEDKHDLELLMVASKYHDVGRKTDAHEEHAKSSAEMASKKLIEKYSNEDISVISTIIEFHEIPRNIPNVDSIFVDIATKNGVSESQMYRVRQMAEILRDADALDRTRFINKARLNPQFLAFDESKKLIKFAASLQETYAIEDLKEYHCDEAIDILLQKHTPQEVIRTIRHCTRGSLKIEDVQNFINMWANSVLQGTEGLGVANTEESVSYGL